MSHALATVRHGGRRPPVTHLQENDRCRNRRLREVGSVLARHSPLGSRFFVQGVDVSQPGPKMISEVRLKGCSERNTSFLARADQNRSPVSNGLRPSTMLDRKGIGGMVEYTRFIV